MSDEKQKTRERKKAKKKNEDLELDNSGINGLALRSERRNNYVLVAVLLYPHFMAGLPSHPASLRAALHTSGVMWSGVECDVECTRGFWLVLIG